METEQVLAPRARSHNLVERDVDGEHIIFDRTSDVGHRLPREVAATWKRCDGQTTVPEIAGASATELGRPVFEEEIWRHLVQLGDLGLLEEAASRRPAGNRYSRRSMLVKVGVAGAIGVGLPLITSIPAARADDCSQVACTRSSDCVRYGCSCCVPSSNNCSNGHGNCLPG
jgi:hypothetical protein